jgi:plasmid stabilization system protein ParE
MVDNVYFLSEANTDIDAICDYHLQKSITNARRTISIIFRALGEEGTPLIGMSITNHIIPDLDFRVITAGEYLIFYRITNNIAYVSRILSSKRDCRKIAKYFKEYKEYKEEIE